MGRSALPTHVGPGLGPTLMCCVEDVGSKVMFGSYNLFMYFFFTYQTQIGSWVFTQLGQIFLKRGSGPQSRDSWRRDALLFVSP